MNGKIEERVTFSDDVAERLEQRRTRERGRREERGEGWDGQRFVLIWDERGVSGQRGRGDRMWVGVGRCPCPSPRMVSSAKHCHYHSTTSAYVNVVLSCVASTGIDWHRRGMDAILSHDSSNSLFGFFLSPYVILAYTLSLFYFFQCQMLLFFFWPAYIIRSALPV